MNNFNFDSQSVEQWVLFHSRKIPLEKETLHSVRNWLAWTFCLLKIRYLFRRKNRLNCGDRFGRSMETGNYNFPTFNFSFLLLALNFRLPIVQWTACSRFPNPLAYRLRCTVTVYTVCSPGVWRTESVHRRDSFFCRTQWERERLWISLNLYGTGQS